MNNIHKANDNLPHTTYQAYKRRLKLTQRRYDVWGLVAAVVAYTVYKLVFGG